MEYYRPQLEDLTGGSKQQVPITIEDLGNVVNGYTDPFKTRIALFAYPPTSDELAVCEDWWQLVGSHEYIHMLQMSRTSGIPKLLRIGFSNYLLPELWQPGWMTEGITVYGESQLSRYTGRLNGGTYHSIISAMAKNNKLPSPSKASYYSFDAPQANYYVYGGAFFSYLAETYGEDKFARLYDKTSSSLLAYFNGLLPLANLDGAYQKTYGKSLANLWQEWVSFEQQKPYKPPSRRLTADGWFKSNLQVTDNKLYYIAGKADKTGPNSSFFSYKLYQVDIPAPVVMDDKMPAQVFPNNRIEPEVLIEQSSDFPAGYHVANGNLYYTRSELHKGFANNEMDGYGGSVEIWQQDLTNGNHKKLYQGQIRAFLPMPDGTLLISEDNETHTASTLYGFNPQTKVKSILYKSDMLIHTILANGDKLILGVKNRWQNCSIYSFDPADSKLEPIVNTPFYTTPVSVAGDSLLFNAVFDGKTGAYVYNVTNRYCYRLGDFDDIRTPVILPNQRALFISLNSGGYDIYQDELTLTQYNIPEDDIPEPPVQKIDAQYEDSARNHISGYAETYFANLTHMAVPRLMHIPIIEGTNDSLAFGFMLSGNDVVGDFPFWSASFVYDTKFSQLKYALALENNFFRPIKQIIGYSNTDEQSLSSMQSVALFKRANYGMQAVNAGFSFLTKDDSQRKIWTPFVDLNVGWATGNLFARQSVPYETRFFLPSDRYRVGWQSYIQYHQKLPFNSELKTTAQIADDKAANEDEVFGSIRGYDYAFETNQGAVFQANWYKPIIKIREGLWNPQIYLEDVNLGFFCDAAAPFPQNEALRQTSGGLEIITELGLAYNLRLNFGVRFSFNQDEVTMAQFFIDTLF